MCINVLPRLRLRTGRDDDNPLCALSSISFAYFIPYEFFEVCQSMPINAVRSRTRHSAGMARMQNDCYAYLHYKESFVRLCGSNSKEMLKVELWHGMGVWGILNDIENSCSRDSFPFPFLILFSHSTRDVVSVLRAIFFLFPCDLLFLLTFIHRAPEWCSSRNL